MASHHGVIAHLLPQAYKRMVAEWLEEDCPSFDYGGFVVGEKLAEATLLGKSAVSSALCFEPDLFSASLEDHVSLFVPYIVVYSLKSIYFLWNGMPFIFY